MTIGATGFEPAT